MTTENIQDKRDGMELALVFLSEANPEARKAIVNCFYGTLSDYLLQLLDPSMTQEQAMWVRAKAVGLVETLSDMGVKISKVSEPIARPARKVVTQAIGTDY